jgi:hypothetical protein
VATKAQLTGMTGVFLTAAELSQRGFVVSLTSRGAAGADLLITDLGMQTAWSVQVKTNSKHARFWLVGEHALRLVSPTHAYVFVNIMAGGKRPVFLVATSAHVAASVVEKTAKSGTKWWEFPIEARMTPGEEGWEEVFGSGLGGPSMAP